MDQSQHQQLVQDFLDSCVKRSSSLAGQINGVIQLAELYLSILNDTAIQPPSAESFGDMMGKISEYGFQHLLEETLTQANPGTEDMIKGQFAQLLVTLKEEVAQNTATILADQSLTSDLERAASYMISYGATKNLKDSVLQGIYNEIMATKPETVWGVLCVFPLIFSI